MTTSLLALGASGFVGRAVVNEGLRRGYEVATFNRGRGVPASPEVEQLFGDRLDRASLAVLDAPVYALPLALGFDESAPTVDASLDADRGDYPELKRRAELAVLRSFGERALLARAGLIGRSARRCRAAAVVAQADGRRR